LVIVQSTDSGTRSSFLPNFGIFADILGLQEAGLLFGFLLFFSFVIDGFSAKRPPPLQKEGNFVCHSHRKAGALT